MKKDTYATWRSLFILSFEFEYRTIRTIKRDTNGELGWFQVLIVSGTALGVPFIKWGNPA
jgi:SH3-like domain-containing protein